MVEVRKITARETYEIRLKVLRINSPLSYKFQGDLDGDTFHLGAFENKKLLTVASFVKSTHPSLTGSQYHLRGMATLESFQNRGFGKILLQEAEVRLRSLDTEALWCNARVIAFDFYLKQGFEFFGEIFNIEDVGPHAVMVKKLRT
jgi:ribosomal protein S18 acetylase RimI-like enzyme